nr:putative ADP-ribosyltransferase exoenzyme [Prescottella equi]
MNDTSRDAIVLALPLRWPADRDALARTHIGGGDVSSSQ